ncbi:hypothetical protein [Litchfieldia salsa]|uniref:Uncharacterized protein n=1 Tax=Litchfieldia salsa TaxID=930152 RepID=A0A1H0TXQ6_9BACI|nr:hypothetical protein [Litchfieldia salsa]SDP58713.1 hypothetical protein SAMN05216565_10411 [Litchfieldia salsa]
MRIKIGDVFQIETSKGLAFFQYVLKHDSMGSLIRILPNLHKDNNTDKINELVEQKELFFIHFPVGAALRRKIVCKVGNFQIPNGLVLPTKFRDKHIVRSEFISWHIVDYETYQIESVKKLTDEQLKLSPMGTWNDTLLIERLEEGWTLDKWI